jgi:hypothetical protein
MLKYILLILTLFVLEESALGQTKIYGKVVDGKTFEALPYVNVFLNNTTIGTITDNAGEYTLTIPTGEFEVVFSFVGYQPKKKKVSLDNDKTSRFDVELLPAKQELKTVTVTSSKDKEWEKLLKQFERTFLGGGYAATQCRIINPWCIDLERQKISGKPILVARASQPIEIENLALGYKLYYNLQLFQATTENYKFSGYVHFVALETSDSTQAVVWHKNRLDAYHGSTRHLFKSIIDKRIEEEGFALYAYRPFIKKTIKRSTVFAQDLNKVVIPYQPSAVQSDTINKRFDINIGSKIEIHYLRAIAPNKTYVDISAPVASMNFTSRTIKLNNNGVILNPSIMTTMGYMSDSRVADLLPYDYLPEKQADFFRIDPVSLDVAGIALLEEKVYLHTDKSYYYPGDMVWFKGYLKYRSPQLFDSLSAALYVDLISPEHKILQTKIFQIDSGRVVGDLVIPNYLEPGHYYLRAYTNWMRNYDAKNLFVKPLPVLGLDENVESTVRSTEHNPAKIQLEIKQNKDTYYPRDSISLTISLKDEWDNPVAAELSVSITDMKTSVPLQEESNIVKSFAAQDDKLNSVKNERSFAVEYGISLTGQFRNDREKPKKARLTIIQGNLDDMVEVDTDEQGYFSVNGFQCFDSTEFSLRATDLKRRKLVGKISLHPKEFPMVEDTLPQLKLSVTKAVQKYRVPTPDASAATILEEVVIKGDKIEIEPRTIPQIGRPDIALDHVYFSRTNATDLLESIMKRVPGMRLLYVDDTYYVLLSPISSLGSPSSMEPLLVIDGVPDHSVGTVMDKISTIHPSSVQRVEVFKYGSGAIYGMHGSNGVIAIYTKLGDKPEGHKEGFDKSLFQQETIRGFSVPNKFKSPSYGKIPIESIPPDYRTTLYWEPLLRTDSETGKVSVSFYAAHKETTYRVIVEGVTSTGEPIHREQIIEILK